MSDFFPTDRPIIISFQQTLVKEYGKLPFRLGVVNIHYQVDWIQNYLADGGGYLGVSVRPFPGKINQSNYPKCEWQQFHRLGTVNKRRKVSRV